MADMIEMDGIQVFDSDSDNEILDLIDAVFDDLCYLEESQNKRYITTRYYSKGNDPNNCNLSFEARLHPDIGAGRLDVGVLPDLAVRYLDKAFRAVFRLWKSEFALLLFMIDHLSAAWYRNPIKGTRVRPGQTSMTQIMVALHRFSGSSGLERDRITSTSRKSLLLTIPGS